MLGTDFSSLLAPFVALAIVLGLCRWVFSTSHRDKRAVARRSVPVSTGDYGLLVPVATVRAQEDADLLRGVLAQAGIRGTVAAAPDGGLSLLVFRDDAGRAKDLVSS
ncbi:MAG: hypothetical protein JWO60_2172 [Frankiales bacterium]|nr:hypothetical protein [Frankiales bacterium]